MKYKKVLLLSVIIFSLFSSLFSINVLCTPNNIDYTFDENILFDDTNFDYQTSLTPIPQEAYNLKYQQEYTEIYNGTYSFTNIPVNTNGTDINFVDSIEGNGLISIINNFSGHSKVLKIDSGSAIPTVAYNNFPNQESGTIEFWIASSDASDTVSMYFQHNDDNIFAIIINNDLIRIWSGAYDFNGDYLDNSWIHIRVDFESGGGGYNGLAPDNFRVYINGIVHGDYTFNINAVHLNKLYVDVYHNAETAYFDGIGYSWNKNFDFERDIIGNQPLSWLVQSFGTGIGTVESFQESKVFKILDDDINEAVDVSTSFNQSINQLIEYDIAINDITLTSGYNMGFTEGGSGRISLIIDNDDLDYHNGVDQLSVKDDFIIVNTLFKITIILDDSANTFDIYIDDILEGNDLDYISNSIVSLNGLTFASDGVQVSITYLDNFFFSSITNNYYISQNLFPYVIKSKTIHEVDRYEFALNDIHTFNAIDSSNPNGWTDVQNGGGTIQIKLEQDGSYDRIIKLKGSSISDKSGIKKEDFDISGKFINVSLGVYFDIMDGGVDDNFTFLITSSDNSDILYIEIRANLEVWYNDGGVMTNSFRTIDLSSNKRYDFSFSLNYELNRIYFVYSRNDVIKQKYNFEMITLNKEGLKKIFYQTTLYSNNDMVSFVDYIGIYNNGKSQVDFGVDFGIALIDTENPWNLGNHNLFNFIANGTFHIAGTSLGYSFARETPPIKETTTYYNENQIINIYDDSIIHLYSGVVVLTVLGNNFNFSYLKISGVILNDTYSSYSLIFESSGVNIHESFFYVDNNRLQFTHISNDTDTEYIQARFNINDTSSTDATIHFRSLINNNAHGFFRINYTTTSDFIPFPTVQSSTSIFLTQGKNIRDFLIIISDLDVDTITGLTSGFVDNVKLFFLGNVEITIITLSLVGMIVPLIIILTPTVALKDLYGESFVVPVFLLMSLILTIGQLIPIWLFFIIAISSSLFLIKENIQKDD